MKALEGIKVLDLTRVLAGPYCSMMLADFGADVIKIEPPMVGDDARAFGPFVGREPFVGKESAYFMCLNRNKRSVELNLKHKAEADLFREMVKQSDVVLENFRPGTMEKLGLGYEELTKINSKLVYAACSSFGHSGPYQLKPAYDIIVQAMGGMMSITGHEGGEPTRVGASLGDVIAGIFTAYGVMLALFHRGRTGEGQLVDVGMLDCQVAALETAIARYTMSGVLPKPVGNRHPLVAPFASFTAKDGHIIVGAGNDQLWVRLCDVLGHPELADDPRFGDNEERSDNVEELTEILNVIFAGKTVEEWMMELEKAELPCAPINTIDRIVNDPQIAARDMMVELEHPIAGHQKMVGIPIKMSLTPGTVDKPAPLLGQHTAEVLREMFSWDKRRTEAFFVNAQ